MHAAELVRTARRSSSLTQRALAKLAGTSHPTVARYEAGRIQPSLATLERLVEAAGYALDVRLERRIRSSNGLDRGEELMMALELAAQFPGHRRPAQIQGVFRP